MSRQAGADRFEWGGFRGRRFQSWTEEVNDRLAEVGKGRHRIVPVKGCAAYFVDRKAQNIPMGHRADIHPAVSRKYCRDAEAEKACVVA